MGESRRVCRGVFGAVVLLALAGRLGEAAASDPASETAPAQLRFSGYGTIAGVHGDSSEPWGFRRDLTQPTVSPRGVHLQADSRLGLQANWRPHAQWEAVVQAVLRQRGSESPAQESIEWAFLSHRPQPDLAVRIGRVSPDMFLFADHRNVGFAYPWVRPSVEFYGWMPVYSIDGIDAAQSWQSGDDNWQVKVYAGRSRMTLAATAGYPDMGLHGRLSGASLSREAGGLTIKLSLAQGRFSVRGAPILDDLRTGLHLARQLPVPSVAAEAARFQDIAGFHDFSMRYASIGAAWAPSAAWLLHAELARVSGSLHANNGWYGYASAGYRVGKVTVFSSVGRAKPSSRIEAAPDWAAALTPVIGSGAAAEFAQVGAGAAEAHNLTRRDQRTLSLGMRWDVAPRTGLKFQWDHVRVAPSGSALWGDSTEASSRAQVLSVALDFVF
jgi:hypothetical protein